MDLDLRTCDLDSGRLTNDNIVIFYWNLNVLNTCLIDNYIWTQSCLSYLSNNLLVLLSALDYSTTCATAPQQPAQLRGTKAPHQWQASDIVSQVLVDGKRKMAMDRWAKILSSKSVFNILFGGSYLFSISSNFVCIMWEYLHLSTRLPSQQINLSKVKRKRKRRKS